MAATTTTSAALAFALLLCFLMTTAHAGSGFGHRQNHKWPRVVRDQHQIMAAGGGDLVNQTCANVSRNDIDFKFSVEDCVSELRSDKRSAEAKDARDLTLIALDLVGLSAAAADTKVDGALKNGSAKGDKITERSLRLCRMDYDTVARLVPECRAAVPAIPSSEEGFVDAWDCLTRLIDAAWRCVGSMALGQDAVARTLSTEMDEVVKRAELARAILAVN